MDKLVRIVASHRGEESLEDLNHFRYCNNGQGMFTTHWRFSKRSCLATISTRNSTGNVTSTTLPEHNRMNKLIKEVAKQTEEAVLDQFASIKK